MNRSEAFNILGLSPDASEADAKKRYRELSKKWHPDVSKEPNAPEKFKEINAAYSKIQEPEEEVQEFNGFGGGFNISDLISHVFNQQQMPAEIRVPLTVSFEQSILGAEVKISYNRSVKCDPCNGQGFVKKPGATACKTCNGRGVSTIRQANAVFQTVCGACKGKKIQTEDCESCSGNGSNQTDVTYSVNIPAGVENDNVLRMPGAGNYFRHAHGEQYLDAFVVIKVNPKENFSLRNSKDVVSKVNISLLEALEGATKEFPTIHGNVSVKVPSNTKNKDELEVNGYGVKTRGGKHIFTVTVDYPTYTQKIIEILKGN